MLCCLFSAALWSPAGKRLTSLDPLVCGVLLCFVTLPCDGLGQVWCLIVSIPDICLLSNFIQKSSVADSGLDLDLRCAENV